MATHYAVLNVKATATARQIKSGYLREAKRWHPDRNLDSPLAATERFTAAAAAFEVLKDPRRKRAYDAKQRRSRRRAGESPSASSENVRGATTNRSAAAAAVEREVLCTLEELYNGVAGKAVDEELVIVVERGCVAGEAIVGSGVRCVVREAPHRVYRRCGNDLHIVMPIAMEDALCGCNLFIPTLANHGRPTPLLLEPLLASSEVRVAKGLGFSIRGRARDFGNLQLRFVIALAPPPRAIRTAARAELRALRERWSAEAEAEAEASQVVEEEGEVAEAAEALPPPLQINE